MRFSVAAAAFLATAVAAADYGYAPASTVTEDVTVTIDCEKEPAHCPYGGHKPTPVTTKTTTTTLDLHPTGVYGNGSHPAYTPTYPIVPKPNDDDKYLTLTVTSSICIPSTTTYITKILKPTTEAVKPTGAPVPVPSGGIKKPVDYTNGASGLQMSAFAAVAGVAAFILA